ncbi:hypothetical protein DYH10_00705 [Candidatus Saccharibacteria bacterium CPR2]|nr:hypothetical protein [Candidatus Saccharibacteria bacterium CPR2]
MDKRLIELPKTVFTITYFDPSSNHDDDCVIGVYLTEKSANEHWLSLNTNPEKPEFISYFIEEVQLHLEPAIDDSSRKSKYDK